MGDLGCLRSWEVSRLTDSKEIRALIIQLQGTESGQQLEWAQKQNLPQNPELRAKAS